jgi:Bifunctional DNA primase/polymerase, N-terminal.
VGVLPPKGVLVLDIDEREALRWLPLPRGAPFHATPSGGFHIFLRLPDGVDLPARTRALPGVDLRGMGRAYVAAPPSRTSEGVYRVILPLRPPDELPLVPEALLERLLPKPVSAPPSAVFSGAASPKRLTALLAWGADRVRRAPVGTRHDTLLRVARLMGGYLHLGLEEAQALHALVEAALEAGLPHEEAIRTARWGLEVGKVNPLPLPERGLSQKLEGAARAKDLALALALTRS